MQQIQNFTHVASTTIFNVTNGVSDAAPSAIDIGVNLPEITFETADIPYMGTLSVVDQTRVGNLEITADLQVANPDAQRLIGPGLKEWKVVWVESIVLPNSLLSVRGFYVYAKGYVSAIPDGEKTPGSQATGSYKMNCVSYKKIDDSGFVYYDIDRSQSRLIVNGIDYRADVNRLLEG